MSESEMLAHLDLHARRKEAIDIVWPGEFRARPARVESILARFREQTHLNAASERPQQCIADARIGKPIHREIDLLVLEIDLRDRAGAVVLGKVLVGQEVERWIDRERRIAAAQWTSDVAVVAIQ